ncbi:MAG: S41 family peptidase [bacterium]|nr:S41 family peptidase [bacterium]
MSIKNALKSATAIAIVIAFASVAVAQGKGDKDVAGSVSESYKALNLFGDVFEQARANYVEKVEDKKLIEYALNGMLSSLDPHSNYMTAEESKAMEVQNRGEFGGLGIEVTMENSVVKVVSPIDDTPAARAGIQSGDLIVELDGKQVMGMTLSEAIEKMRGKIGTEIVLTVIREGAKEPLKFRLVRDNIQIKSVRSRVIDGKAGYIRITQFNAQTYDGLKKAIADAQKEAGDKLMGFILDLRNNPGGLLDQAIKVSDVFIDKGEIVSTRGRNPEDTRRDNATAGDLTNGLPLVVIINGGSASASEIVAGALQDHKRAILMGTQSFGKGSVQTLFPAPGGGAIKLTTARYFTPSGRSIQAKGITPDLIVERAKVVAEKEGFGEIHEADLKGALSNPNAPDKVEPTLLPDDATKDDKTSETGDKKDDPKAKDAKAKQIGDKDDYQLVRALDLLVGIGLSRGLGGPVTPVNDNAAVPEKK